MQRSKVLKLSTSLAVMLQCVGGNTYAAPEVAALEPSAFSGSAVQNELSKYFYGHASINDTYGQHLQAGLEALDRRIFGTAQAHLNAAVAELRKHNISDDRWLQARLALGEALLGEERLDQAQHAFADVAGRTRNERMQVIALSGQAEALRQLGDTKRAHAVCEQALNLQERSHAAPAKEHARLYTTLGGILSAEGLHKPAVSAFQQALKISDSQPNNEYDVANIRYQLAVELHKSGANEEATSLFEKAFAELDKQAKFNQPLYSAPCLVSKWEQGNPRARQIADNEYPLKYLLSNNLRVAAAAVRSENVIGVLISLANCGRQRMQLAVGPVNFEQELPKRKMFLYVPPRELDIPLEEEHITELTWRRRWLNHIEKTRFIPGYLKNSTLDVDNFFGNNIFGAYGNWPIIANDETPIVTREEFLYGKNKQKDISTADFLSGGTVGYRPTYLEPGESKTGLVFFKQERFDAAKLRIVVGNTIFEIPFSNAGPR